MNKVTAESRERDYAVTLFGPGDYCALTLNLNMYLYCEYTENHLDKSHLISKSYHLLFIENAYKRSLNEYKTHISI